MIMEVEHPSSESANRRILLLKMVETRVRESTHNRVRNLSVEEVHGRFVVGGQVASHHTKQLALQGALELLTGEQFASEIVVNTAAPRRPLSI